MNALRDFAEIAARRILVVAPHPDDESLGCGGLIWTLAARGAKFFTAFVTDGGASHLHSKTWPRERLAAAREAEGAEALRRLRIGDAPRAFLRLPDAGMPVPGSESHATALAEAGAIVGGFQPDLVLLPWRRDPHRDHRDSWRLFTDALAAKDVRPATLEYAIWLDEIGERQDHPRPDEMERLDFAVSEALAPKRDAVRAHVTQVSDLIADDPTAFRLTEATIDRLAGPVETYWRPSS
ncbi:PIG-L deacetylase family protein [Aureimonas psammosilenae]|uniref:PIG-L deacetylase family protein n=1 Tax=Aureimonas psammosilenae TaxID=2495496 RepID=UPI001869953D|nr:PIG-L deacetylase family protein [Aureimonas psammosilenae]